MKWVPISQFKDVSDGIYKFSNPALNTTSPTYDKVLLDETKTPMGGIWGKWDQLY